MTKTDRIVIVGAGLSALYAALRLAPRPVLVLSPDPLGQGASSAWAQGGVAAALAATDSPTAHAADTIAAGAGIVDADVATRVTGAARDHILALTALGTPFDRDAAGSYVMSREAAHSAPRVVRVSGDQAGRAIMEALIAHVRATPSIQVMEGVIATGLELSAGAVSGLRLARSDGSTGMARLACPAVLLAGGGSGALYARTTNPPRIRGEVLGLAAHAGALIADPEFVQFHPTALDTGANPAPLVTEALRGEGAVLINRAGDRFMTGLHPDAELAPRDIVARAVFAETMAGRGPMLDTRAAVGADIATRFPAVAAACRASGIDPVRQAIPIAAAAHYHMGGVATDAAGRTSLTGLWACGEVAATGLHGANRLASNGLLEALVYADAAARDIAEGLPEATRTEPPVNLVFSGAAATRPDPGALARLRSIMETHVGLIRDGDGLSRALSEIALLEKAAGDCEPMRNMTATATLIAAAALDRRESRGSHFRSDCPDPDSTAPRRSYLTLDQARELRAKANEGCL
ncbi:MAG: L-aspartate oxidase [Albidovulum sp.]|uniref:L-aspartate oxidase n=1 Tax=Albidovulum sp. TaxID=1872424 RepID=UPI003CB9717E